MYRSTLLSSLYFPLLLGLSLYSHWVVALCVGIGGAFVALPLLFSESIGLSRRQCLDIAALSAALSTCVGFWILWPPVSLILLLLVAMSAFPIVEDWKAD